MIIENINNLKITLRKQETQSICIIDNNFISFLLKLKQELDISYILSSYDLILIPKWVEVEINDSEYRKSCLEEIASYKDIYIVDELLYSELYDYKDYALSILFLASISLMAKERGKLGQFIKSQGEEIDPDLFINELYNNILISEEGITKSGRVKRKNAGEISICVLSHIIRYHYTQIDTITVLSFDADCYDFINKSKDDLYYKKDIYPYDDNIFKEQRKVSVSFKSNDFILKEMYSLGKDENMDIIDKVRTDDRYVKYTHKKKDGSIEEEKQLMNNEEFKQFLQKEDVYLIF